MVCSKRYNNMLYRINLHEKCKKKNDFNRNKHLFTVF